jgi:regulatory protein
MSIITQIKIQAKNKNRVNVHLDGKFFCGLAVEAVVKHSLKVGSEVSEQELELLQFESDKQMAFSKVLNLISKSPKTKKQIYDYLKNKGYAQKTIEYVISKLEEYNYINDAVYAKNYVNFNINSKGVRRLRQELMLKGVNAKIIDEALASIDFQEEVVERLANKYMLNKQKNQKNYAKLYAYLTRRGFSYDQIAPHLRIKEK